MPFSKSFLTHVYWKCFEIKCSLQKSPMKTPMDLLEIIEPSVAKLYKEAFNQGKTLKERFKFVQANKPENSHVFSNRMDLAEA